jgi:medium-chain acyl-[acyl-carrier-protein] hydrolase
MNTLTLNALARNRQLYAESRKIYLFALPFAGGSASVFYRFTKWMPPEVILVPIDLDDHWDGDVFDIAVAAQKILCKIAAITQGEKFMLLGYSMGGLLAYEISRQLEQTMTGQLILLIIFACRSPNSHHISWNDMTPEKMVSVLCDLQVGSDSAIAESVLRNNIENIKPHLIACDKYCSSLAEHRIKAPISATSFMGDALASPDCMRGWKQMTHHACRIKTYQGNHFTLFQSNSSHVVSAMVRDIQNAVLPYQHY